VHLATTILKPLCFYETSHNDCIHQALLSTATVEHHRNTMTVGANRQLFVKTCLTSPASNSELYNMSR
jgi:hypothetical protein